MIIYKANRLAKFSEAGQSVVIADNHASVVNTKYNK